MKKTALISALLALCLGAAAQPAREQIPNVILTQRASFNIVYGGPTRAEGRSYKFTPTFFIHPDGKLDFHEFIMQGRLVVPMLVKDAAMYGETKSATVGTTYSYVNIGGNYPADVLISCEEATPSSSNLWGVRFDNKGYMRVPVTQASSVSIDAASREVKVNNATSMITLDSDWAKLEPGRHSVKIDAGSGSATITWTGMEKY